MIVAISGTPATGKTIIAKALAKKLKGKIISIHGLVKTKKIPSKYDAKRKTRVVDVRKLKAAVKKEVYRNKTNIVEGHLSHFVEADLFVILRCRPDVLEKRMKKKGWSKKKIHENLQAEILDTITIEALQKHKKNKILEIDTTKKTPSAIASLIVKLLNNHRLQNDYRAGRIDWSEKFVKYLVERLQDYNMSA